MGGEALGGERRPRRLDHRTDGDDGRLQLRMPDLVEDLAHPGSGDPQLLGVDHERDHDLDVRVLATLEQAGGGGAQRSHLHLVHAGAQHTEPHTARPDHRIGLTETPDRDQFCALLGGQLAAGLASGEVDEVGEEFVQRRVEQPNRHRARVHGVEQALEVVGLGDFEFGERRRLGLGVGGEDEAAHDRQPVVGQEHVLRPAQADPPGPE